MTSRMTAKGHPPLGAAKRRYSQKQVIDALNQAKGNVSATARALGCTDTTVYNYMRRYPSVVEVWRSHRRQIVDMAEDSLKVAVARGESWAVQFALARLGKDRGYGEQPEAHGPQQPVKITFNIAKANAALPDGKDPEDTVDADYSVMEEDE